MMGALWKVNIVRYIRMTILTGIRLMWTCRRIVVVFGFYQWQSLYENLNGLKWAESPFKRQVQRKNSKVQSPRINPLKQQLV